MLKKIMIMISIFGGIGSALRADMTKVQEKLIQLTKKYPEVAQGAADMIYMVNNPWSNDRPRYFRRLLQETGMPKDKIKQVHAMQNKIAQKHYMWRYKYSKDTFLTYNYNNRNAACGAKKIELRWPQIRTDILCDFGNDAEISLEFIQFLSNDVTVRHILGKIHDYDLRPMSPELLQIAKKVQKKLCMQPDSSRMFWQAHDTTCASESGFYHSTTKSVCIVDQDPKTIEYIMAHELTHAKQYHKDSDVYHDNPQNPDNSKLKEESADASAVGSISCADCLQDIYDVQTKYSVEFQKQIKQKGYFVAEDVLLYLQNLRDHGYHESCEKHVVLALDAQTENKPVDAQNMNKTV